MAVAVKICGLKDEAGLGAALKGGASYLGLVFAPKSKRYISYKDAAALIKTLPQPALSRFCQAAGEGDVVLTALFVNPTDSDIMNAVEALRPCLGMIQLHGNETAERVSEVKRLSKLPVMKAIPVAVSEDLNVVPEFEAVADMLLFDAKVDGQTGGTGHSFDWSLLKNLKLTKPWMLAGGLDEINVREAVTTTGTRIVDVSSGVETDGVKDPEKIRSFLSIFTSCRC